MELQLGLALPTPGFDQLIRDKDCVKNKRGFEQAFGNLMMKQEFQAMPLLLWSGQPPNEEDDDHRDQKKRNSSTINDDQNDAEKEDEVVGWPPIKSWRKKVFHHHQVGCRLINDHNNRNMAMAMAANGGSIYVKVKMEGVAIARKIDISLYHSYQALTNSLSTMFPKDQKCDEDDYTLTYQDKDGDWLIAGDIPWQTFTRSVKRLKIVKNSG